MRMTAHTTECLLRMSQKACVRRSSFKPPTVRRWRVVRMRLFWGGSDLGFVSIPLLFIESQCLFEQGKIGVVEAFSCLAAVLTDFLFLHRSPHPRESILSFEVFQLKEVLRQHCFPLIQRMHIFFLIMNHERDSSSWTDDVHSKGCYEASA